MTDVFGSSATCTASVPRLAAFSQRSTARDVRARCVVAARGGKLCTVGGEQNQTNGAFGSEQRLRRMDSGAANAVAARCGDELDARMPQRKLACSLPFLLANQPGHARDDEQEQDRRGDDDDQDVGVAELFCEADARSDQARDGEEAQPQRRQTRRTSVAGWSRVRIEGWSAAAPHRT